MTFGSLCRQALTVGLSILFVAAPSIAEPTRAEPSDSPLPFYTWNGAVPEKSGTVLRSEALPATLSVPAAAKSVRLLYVSTSGIDAQTRVAVSGALFLPAGSPPAGGWPLVSWAHGTTGIADACAPSRIARSPRDAAYLDAWLAAGYAVAASDYEGLGTKGIHPYSNYRAASYSVLDIARAASSGAWPISERGLIIVGQSQGAAAAVAAGGYSSVYAPDLAVAGVVATGLPNLSRKAIESGLAWSATDAMVTGAYAMIGYELSRVHPEIVPRETFTEAGMELNDRVPTTCLGDLMKLAADRKLDPPATFRPDMLARLWNTDVALRAYPTDHLAMPLFVGIGLLDTAALPATTFELVKDMCGAGGEIVVRAYAGQDHGGVVNAAAPAAIRFASESRAGPVSNGFCSSK